MATCRASLETRLWPQMPRKCGHFAQKRPPVWDYGYAWLGRQDSNLGMVESKSTALPLGDAPSGGRTIVISPERRYCGLPVSKTDFLLTANLTESFQPFGDYEGPNDQALRNIAALRRKAQNWIRVFKRQQQPPSISGTGPCDELGRGSDQSRGGYRRPKLLRPTRPGRRFPAGRSRAHAVSPLQAM